MSGYLSDRPIFNWPYFKCATLYNENSTRVRFGNGYTFSARPDGPPQRTFKVRFEVLYWETMENGLVTDTIRPNTNLYRLVLFYQDVELWKSFWFNVPGIGPVLVRFAKPLQIPEGTSGGTGAVGPIELELIEQPLAHPPPPNLPSEPWGFDTTIYTMDDVYATMDQED